LRAKRLANGPIRVVGDAAHAMSPQLGLEATLAVQDALTLARAVRERGPLAGPAAYSRRRWCAVHGYQLLSKALTPCFQANARGLWRDIFFATGFEAAGRPAADVP
jgi:2-polyprenyl-6-methoxyphenol hydroxylase-like FAD-dependent oxidoreductase